MQLNTHKSKNSLITLIDEKFLENNNIALIQEPPVNRKGEVIGYPFPLTCLQTTNKPRAIIIHNPSLEVWQIPSLSDRDCQTAIWRNAKSKPIIIISAYWDINFPNFPEIIMKAIIEAKNKRFDLILGLDSNAHHQAWGSPDSNARGEMLESILKSHNLDLLNNGSATFRRVNCETHIDITAITHSLKFKIKSWEVVDEDMLSDHLCLHTVVSHTAKYKRIILNHKKTDWQEFSAQLERLEWPQLIINDVDDIEEATKILTDRVKEAANSVTPKIYVTGHHKKEGWWNEDLRQMRRDLRSIRTNSNDAENYIEQKRNYQREIRKAKRIHWQMFLDKCQSISDTAKLTRILTKDKTKPVGLTIKPDGTATWNNVDSTKNIINSLFPDSLTSQPTQTKIHNDHNYTTSTSTTTPVNTDDWINYDSIVSIISTLKVNKAPGPDEVTAKMLKNFPKKVILFLINIYKHIIQFSFVPKQWCESKAIFIPKSNKPNKTDPKSFRPICLSNVMFKILEKLIQNHLEQHHIYPDKLSNRQHGFRPNMSTLTALSTFTNFIENSFSHGEMTLAVFLDIHGAFDNIKPYRAIKQLHKWGSPQYITDTLTNYYSKRVITTTVAPTNETIKIFPTKGTAQGNVLSPMLWNCIVDQVGDIMDRHNIGGCIFADDIVVAAKGNNLKHITTTIQKALDNIEAWAEDEGLKFNLGKSHPILFQNNNKKNHSIPITLNGKNLNYQESTKYLGVTLNNKLRWTEHFNNVFKASKRDMIIINKALQKSLGPSPKLTHWIYTGIIRPKITYASHIWCGAISNFELEKRSRQIQRWALTKMGPIRQNTPTAGLEIITRTIPLHIHLQEVSLKTIHNFITKNFVLNPSPKGHLKRWFQLMEKYIPLALKPSDKCSKLPAPYFKNRIDHSKTQEGTTIYTDGSMIDSNCGSGFVIQWENKTRYGLSYNGKYHTVFLSEVKAITLAIEKFLSENINTKIVNIFSDCQSAIAAILGRKSGSREVQQCWNQLHRLDASFKWSLSWVKAHVGIKGNETADSLAKKATLIPYKGNQPFLPVAPNHVNNAFKKFSYANWETYWEGRIDCRQTKLWFPKPNHKEATNIINLEKANFGLMTRWLTGHCFLARHESIINNFDPICNKCFLDDQTPWHLLTECPATLKIRKEIPPGKWTTSIILKAIKSIDYLEVSLNSQNTQLTINIT